MTMSGSSREMVLKEPELTVGTVSNVAKPIPVKKALEEEDFTEVSNFCHACMF